MRGMTGTALSLAVALLATGAASAQTTVYLGGGPTLPTRSFGDVANVGGTGVSGVTVPLGPTGLRIGAEVSYSGFLHRVSGNRSDVYGLGAVARIPFARPGRVIVTAEVVVSGLRHARASRDFPGLEAAELGVALTGRAEASVPLTTVTPFVAVGYTYGLGSLNSSAFPTEAVGGVVGLRVSLGE